MAKKDSPKTASRKALDAFLETHKGKTLTAAQKEQVKKLRDTVGAEDFKRLAVIRTERALRAIAGLSGLAAPRYRYTPEQVLKLSEAFKAALTACFDAFEGKKASAAKLEL